MRQNHHNTQFVTKVLAITLWLLESNIFRGTGKWVRFQQTVFQKNPLPSWIVPIMCAGWCTIRHFAVSRCNRVRLNLAWFSITFSPIFVSLRLVYFSSDYDNRFFCQLKKNFTRKWHRNNLNFQSLFDKKSFWTETKAVFSLITGQRIYNFPCRHSGTVNNRTNFSFNFWR